MLRMITDSSKQYGLSRISGCPLSFLVNQPKCNRLKLCSRARPSRRAVVLSTGRIQVTSSYLQVASRSPRVYSSAAPTQISRVELGTRIHPAGFLHKGLQPDMGSLAMSDVSQRPRPLADRLAIDFIATRAANDRSEWICVLVEGKIGKFKGMPAEACWSFAAPCSA
jgi:hypothetical protein